VRISAQVKAELTKLGAESGPLTSKGSVSAKAGLRKPDRRQPTRLRACAPYFTAVRRKPAPGRHRRMTAPRRPAVNPHAISSGLHPRPDIGYQASLLEAAFPGPRPAPKGCCAGGQRS